ASPGFSHQKNELNCAKTIPAPALRQDDSGETLSRQFEPKIRVVGRFRLHQATNFGHRALAREELARGVLENLLAFTQSKLHARLLGKPASFRKSFRGIPIQSFTLTPGLRPALPRERSGNLR